MPLTYRGFPNRIQESRVMIYGDEIYEGLPEFREEIEFDGSVFEWGYFGENSRWLSYCLLRHYTDDPELAKSEHKEYAIKEISQLPVKQPFKIEALDIDNFLSG